MPKNDYSVHPFRQNPELATNFIGQTQACTGQLRRGVVVSGVRRMNEVNARRAWAGDRLRAGIQSLHVTSQLGQLSLASFRGLVIEYQLRLG